MERTNGIAKRFGFLFRKADGSPDSELLARFIDERDGEAFALLVRRHGPMVHGVCRRVLQNHADADDAFQATFLVLARKARAVRPRSLLVNWLYGVAYRTALEAKRAAAVRRMRERRSAEMRTNRTSADALVPDLRELLDRELATLPDVYRAAIVLCDLEGLSRRDAALRLGWREGTLSGRLARARSMLAERLSRQGLVLGAAGLGGLSGTASAAVPVALAESTTRLGILVAAGEAGAVASASVAALTEGVMKTMLLTKLKAMTMALVVGCAVLATTVGGWQANATGAGEPQAEGRTKSGATPRTTQRDQERDRVAELERERDKLLQMVKELQARLATLEAAQERKKARDERSDLKQAEEELLKQRDRELERARDLLRNSLKEAGQQDLLKLKEDQLKRAQGALNNYRRGADIDTAKLQRLEEERAKAADEKMKSKLKKPEGTAKRSSADDRVEELEARLKALERDFRDLMSEMQRLRRK